MVPDLRGYGRSGKPGAVEAYSLPLLAGDVMAILAELKIARTHLVGHDWGAALAWGLASLAPGSVDHLAVLSVGHRHSSRRSKPPPWASGAPQTPHSPISRWVQLFLSEVISANFI